MNGSLTALAITLCGWGGESSCKCNPREFSASTMILILQTLPMVLKVHGYEVTTAGSVPEALNIITSGQQFDVLTDLKDGTLPMDSLWFTPCGG